MHRFVRFGGFLHARRATSPVLRILLILLLAGNVALALPQQVHLTTTGEPSSTVTVQWVTTAPEATSVRYGTDSLNLGQLVTGSVGSVPNSLSGQTHTAKLVNLLPDTTYYYQCGNLNGWSGVYSFKTAPESPKKFTFAVYGDTGATNIFNSLVTRIHSGARPELNMHLGGLAYAQGLSGQWDTFFNFWQPIAANGITGACMGDEEYEELFGTDVGNRSFTGRMSLPNNEQWFSYNWGTSHFVFYNTEEDIAPNSAQYRWLEADLLSAQRDPGTQWIFTFGHRPIYSSGARYGGQTDLEHLRGLFEEAGVTISFSAHERNYERSHPLMMGTPVVTSDSGTYRNVTGTMYVVSGGGGWQLDTSFDTQPGWSAIRAASYNYCAVTVDPFNWSLDMRVTDPETGNPVDAVYLNVPTPTQTPTPIEFVTPTPEPSRTPFETATPVFFTSTPTASPTRGTPLPTSTPTRTPTPYGLLESPQIWLGGYWTTNLSTAGGNMTLLAVVPKPQVTEVELLYDGLTTGLRLFDDGFHNDFAPRDAVYGIEWTFPEVSGPLVIPLEVRARDSAGLRSGVWPYLTVDAAHTATVTPVPGPSNTPTPTPRVDLRLCVSYVDTNPGSSCNQTAAGLCNAEVTCRDSHISGVVSTNLAIDGDTFEFQFVRNGTPEYRVTDVVHGNCTTSYLGGTLDIDEFIRRACGDTWSCRFLLNGAPLAEKPFTIQSDLPNCECQ